MELFVKPMDLALINKGQDVRLQFDGYPAIVFSGWPNSSYGTFAGKLVQLKPIETKMVSLGYWLFQIRKKKLAIQFKNWNWRSRIRIT